MDPVLYLFLNDNYLCKLSRFGTMCRIFVQGSTVVQLATGYMALKRSYIEIVIAIVEGAP